MLLVLIVIMFSGFTVVGQNAFTQVESGIYYKESRVGDATYRILKISLYKQKIMLKPLVSTEYGKVDEEGVFWEASTPEFSSLTGPIYYRYKTISTLAEENGVKTAVNAGFFNPYSRSGVLEETFLNDGDVLNFRADRAVLSWSDKEAKIGVYKSFDNLPFKQNAIGGGPVFVKDGVYDFDPYDEAFSEQVKKERSEKRNARTAVGLDKRGKNLYIMVVDGNDDLNVGMNAEEMAEILIDDYDVETAMMMDGGGSSSLLIDGELKNQPNMTNDERKILSGLGVVSE